MLKYFKRLFILFLAFNVTNVFAEPEYISTCKFLAIATSYPYLCKEEGISYDQCRIDAYKMLKNHKSNEAKQKMKYFFNLVLNEAYYNPTLSKEDMVKRVYLNCLIHFSK